MDSTSSVISSNAWFCKSSSFLSTEFGTVINGSQQWVRIGGIKIL